MPVAETTSRPFSLEPDVKSLSLADAGRNRTEWAERSMPVLRQIKGVRGRFETPDPLKSQVLRKIRLQNCGNCQALVFTRFDDAVIHCRRATILAE